MSSIRKHNCQINYETIIIALANRISSHQQQQFYVFKFVENNCNSISVNGLRAFIIHIVDNTLSKCN